MQGTFGFQQLHLARSAPPPAQWRPQPPSTIVIYSLGASCKATWTLRIAVHPGRHHRRPRALLERARPSLNTPERKHLRRRVFRVQNPHPQRRATLVRLGPDHLSMATAYHEKLVRLAPRWGRRAQQAVKQDGVSFGWNCVMSRGNHAPLPNTPNHEPYSLLRLASIKLFIAYLFTCSITVASSLLDQCMTIPFADYMAAVSNICIKSCDSIAIQPNSRSRNKIPQESQK